MKGAAGSRDLAEGWREGTKILVSYGGVWHWLIGESLKVMRAIKIVLGCGVGTGGLRIVKRIQGTGQWKSGAKDSWARGLRKLP